LNKRGTLDREIHAEDQPLAADLANEIEFRCELLEPGAQFGSSRADIGE